MEREGEATVLNRFYQVVLTSPILYSLFYRSLFRPDHHPLFVRVCERASSSTNTNTNTLDRAPSHVPQLPPTPTSSTTPTMNGNAAVQPLRAAANKASLDLSEDNLDAHYGDNSLIVMKNDFYNDLRQQPTPRHQPGPLP